MDLFPPSILARPKSDMQKRLRTLLTCVMSDVMMVRLAPGGEIGVIAAAIKTGIRNFVIPVAGCFVDYASRHLILLPSSCSDYPIPIAIATGRVSTGSGDLQQDCYFPGLPNRLGLFFSFLWLGSRLYFCLRCFLPESCFLTDTWRGSCGRCVMTSSLREMGG
jgi:hypothetical protein